MLGTTEKLRNDELLVTALAGTRLRMELDRVPLWRGDHVAVKVENQRIDYSAESVGDRKVVVPDFVTIDTVEQPFPDLPHGRYITRHTLFTESYSGYAASGS